MEQRALPPRTLHRANDLRRRAWIVFETVNIGWPRLPSAPWYENWAVPVMATAHRWPRNSGARAGSDYFRTPR